MENSVSVNETAVMNSIKNGMKNLLFIEGNRSEIDKANVVESYNKIKAMGFIPTMPVEFLPIEQAQNKLISQRFARSGVGHGYFQSRFVRSLCLGGGSEKESQQQKSIWFHAFRVRPL